MTLNGWLQIGFFLLAIFLVTPPLGRYMSKVFARERTWLDPILREQRKVGAVVMPTQIRNNSYCWPRQIALFVRRCIQEMQSTDSIFVADECKCPSIRRDAE
jgi:K+-transporting ATPase A subunit